MPREWHDWRADTLLVIVGEHAPVVVFSSVVFRGATWRQLKDLVHVFGAPMMMKDPRTIAGWMDYLVAGQKVVKVVPPEKLCKSRVTERNLTIYYFLPEFIVDTERRAALEAIRHTAFLEQLRSLEAKFELGQFTWRDIGTLADMPGRTEGLH